MALEIQIVPTLENNGNGMPTTTLDLTVDVTSILDLLKKYDLLLKTTLTVQVAANIFQQAEVNVYEYAQIYKNVKEQFITFRTIVLGDIRDSQSITGHAQGIFVNK